MASPGAPAASWARPKARSASAVPYGERAVRLISSASRAVRSACSRRPSESVA
jgi:hypothetical protein